MTTTLVILGTLAVLWLTAAARAARWVLTHEGCRWPGAWIWNWSPMFCVEVPDERFSGVLGVDRTIRLGDKILYHGHMLRLLQPNPRMCTTWAAPVGWRYYVAKTLTTIRWTVVNAFYSTVWSILQWHHKAQAVRRQ